jgi:hypothetical protein
MESTPGQEGGGGRGAAAAAEGASHSQERGKNSGIDRTVTLIGNTMAKDIKKSILSTYDWKSWDSSATAFTSASTRSPGTFHIT